MSKTKWLTVMGMIISLLVCMITRDPAGATPFYQDKTLTVIIGTSAGGRGDMRARAVTKYLQKHLPGKPALVYKYIRNVVHAPNYTANVAKRNGLSILFIGPPIFSNGILQSRGVRYRVEWVDQIAVADATGVRLFDLPITSEKIYKALQGKTP